MKLLVFVLVTVAYAVAIATANSPLTFETEFISELLNSVKSEILHRYPEFAPAVFGKVSMAMQMTTERPTKTYKVNFMMETYVPGNPEIKMYRLLYCSAEIETFYPHKRANSLRKINCDNSPNMD